MGSSARVIRGGNWNNNSNNLSSSTRNANNPANENNNIGFRVASPRNKAGLAACGARIVGVATAAPAAVPSQGLPDSPAHRRDGWWANKAMCSRGE